MFIVDLKPGESVSVEVLSPVSVDSEFASALKSHFQVGLWFAYFFACRNLIQMAKFGYSFFCSGYFSVLQINANLNLLLPSVVL